MSEPSSALSPAKPVDLSTLARFVAWEERVTLKFNRINHRQTLSLFFGAISRLGDGMFWYLLMAAMLMLDGAKALEPVIVMILAGLSCTLSYKWLKHTTSRPRPCQRNTTIRLTMPPLDLYSFPSGHTLHAVCFSVVATAYYPELGPGLFGFTLLVALSRLVLGLHYLSDVVAGAVIGGTIAFAGLYLATI